MIIFKRKRHDPTLARGAPPGSVVEINESGWINNQLFVQWLHSFAHSVAASKERPAILILDNHSAHISLEAWEFCQNQGIVKVSLPPHTSHRLQPLDVCYMKPFKTAFDTACNAWMTAHPGQKLLQSDVSGLINTANSRACTPATAGNGFPITGIFPLDRGAIADAEFAAAEALGYDQRETTEGHDIQEPFDDLADESTIPVRHPILQSASDYLPLPKSTPPPRKRKAQESMILSGTPVKKMLLAKKKRENCRKALSNRVSVGTKLGTSGTQLNLDSDDDDTPIVSDDPDCDLMQRSEAFLGDFIVVEVQSNKGGWSKIIATVTAKHSNGVTVKFLKCSPKGTGYILSQDDVGFVKNGEIFIILPQPQASGGIARAAAILKFPTDLSAFGIHV